jgi:hypothetical protein
MDIKAALVLHSKKGSGKILLLVQDLLKNDEISMVLPF